MVLSSRKKINSNDQGSNFEYRIKAENVGLIYKVKSEENNKKIDLVVLNDLNLKVKSGEFLSIVGPSGCGKSTFLDVIAGLINISSGKVIIDNKEINGPALDRGIVMQGYALFPWRTIQKNVEFGLEIKGLKKKQREEISKKFIELVGLKGVESRYPHELSGGMKQRIAIARALAYDPEVLLMDEPFAAVDEQTRETLHEELLKIWEKTQKTIIFVTHSIEEAVFLSDRVAVMSKKPGTIKEIINIDLPRPRNNGDLRSSPEFSKIRHKIWELLQDDKVENQESKTSVEEVEKAI